MNLKSLLVVLFTFWVLLVGAQPTVQPVKMQWKVGDTIREALVYLPPDAKTKPSALIFDFHGHGGTMAFAYRKFSIQKVWPEAILVCPQGLNTPGQLTDKEGKKAGWQKGKGQMGDRDLKFFDVMLASLKKDYKVDDKRIYATGHSNGGHFTYLLWAERGDVFAAVAPCAAAATGLLRSLKPKPCFHLMGEKDPLVKPQWQRFTIDAVLRLNSCMSEGVPTGKYTTWYKSATGNPVVLYVHPGGHEYPADASQAIAEFFKQQTKR